MTITAPESWGTLRMESSGVVPSSVSVTKGSICGGASVVHTSLHSPAAMVNEDPLGYTLPRPPTASTVNEYVPTGPSLQRTTFFGAAWKNVAEPPCAKLVYHETVRVSGVTVMYGRPVGGTAVASMLMKAPAVSVTLIDTFVALLGAAVHALAHAPSASVKLPPPRRVPMAGEAVTLNDAGPPDAQITMRPGAPGSSSVTRGSNGAGRGEGPVRVVGSPQAESAAIAHMAAISRPCRKPIVIVLDSKKEGTGGRYVLRPRQATPVPSAKMY